MDPWTRRFLFESKLYHVCIYIYTHAFLECRVCTEYCIIQLAVIHVGNQTRQRALSLRWKFRGVICCMVRICKRYCTVEQIRKWIWLWYRFDRVTSGFSSFFSPLVDELSLSCYHEISLFPLGMSLRNQNLWQQQLTLKRPRGVWRNFTNLPPNWRILSNFMNIWSWIMNIWYTIYIYRAHTVYKYCVYIYVHVDI